MHFSPFEECALRICEMSAYKHTDESAKSYEFRGNVGCVGHNIYVDCIGQIYFCVGLSVGKKSSRGSKIFPWIKYFFFFCVGQLLFTRRDYFTILQLIA